jgi:hypothetical protein
MLQPSICPSANIGVNPHLGPKKLFLLQSDSYEAPSLTRGRIFRLQLLLVTGIAVILMSEFRGTHQMFLSLIPDAPNLLD